LGPPVISVIVHYRSLPVLCTALLCLNQLLAAGGILFTGCTRESVRVCVRDRVLKVYYHDINRLWKFHQIYVTLVQLGTKWN